MKKLAVVFSGAGLSADSGIKTFRDKDGLWENHNVSDVAEHDAWFRNRELMLKFYEERYKDYSKAKPHAGHEALARLEEKYKVIHVTQNIDDLLERGGCTDVRHLHGTIANKKCERHNDIIIGSPDFACDYKTEMKDFIKLGELCPKCDSQLRPDIVWFHEAVKMSFDEVRDWVKEVKYNDGLFICVGTSVQVYPAGYFVSFFSQVSNKYIVDKKPKRVNDYTLCEGTAAEQLPVLVDKLLKQ